MKIIKEFEDREFLGIMYNWYDPKQLIPYSFYWGLGNDGDLYCRCDLFTSKKHWIRPHKSRSNFGELINLQTMKLIIKEFGHLMAFL